MTATGAAGGYAGAGRLGGRLLIAAGLLTLVNNYLPGSEHLDVPLLNGAAGVAVLAGLVATWVPWQRWHRGVTLVLPLLAFLLIGVADRYGGVSDFSYAVYFVVVFVWVGLTQPPLTSLALAPVAVAAYLWPLLTSPHPPANGVSSVTVAVPVCVLVGEVLARSQRRQAEAQRQLAERVELADRQRRHEQAIVDAVADGLLVVAADGRVVSCNDAAIRLLGVRRDALLGRPVPVPVAADGTPVEHEAESRRWLEAVAASLPGTGETVVALHDVTRQRALKEAQDLFLATTSHELRTPLTVVTGYLAFLRRRWDALPDEQRRDAVLAAGERADAMVSLVNHLLLATRVGVGRAGLVAAPYDLAAAAARVVRDHAAVAERHELRLHADEPVWALGDESTVEPILGQLLENAVKYSPDGGRIEVRLAADGQSVRLAVADEGVGLPVGEGDGIFRPFVQGRGGDRREYGGVGLGLHIVRQLVEAQGGRVDAANRPTGGAVFAVTLPKAPAAAAAPR